MFRLRLGKKRFNISDRIEAAELASLGILEEAIEANYNHSDLCYYWADEDHTVVAEADNNGYPTGNSWDLGTFKVWFNEIEGEYE